MATTSVMIKHNAEMAHRLPILPGKCQNLHGHSWLFEIEIEGPMDVNGVIIEYGAVKKIIRDWIDANLDHGTALGEDDPLINALQKDKYHSKTFVVNRFDYDFGWPTVEAMSHIMAIESQALIDGTAGLRGTVVRVRVQETAVNMAEWKLEQSERQDREYHRTLSSASD